MYMNKFEFTMMHLVRSAQGALCVLLCAVFGLASQAYGDEPPFVARQALVRLAPGETLNAFLTRYNTQVVTTPAPISIPQRRIHLVTLAVGVDEPQFVADLAADTAVVWANLNYVAQDVEPEPGGRRMYLRRIEQEYEDDVTPGLLGVPQSHVITRGQGVTVAILDTGVDTTHPRLVGEGGGRLLRGFNFIGNNTDVSDVGDGVDSNNSGLPDEYAGHGTMVAGLIARVAPGAKLLMLKVMDSDGVTDVFKITQGIYHAIDQGATVINISIGTEAPASVLRDAVLEAESRGVMVVASAGNRNQETPVLYPAAFAAEGVIAVAATQLNDVRAGFSNYGPWISISAPGVDVVSLIPVSEGSYGSAPGTSFAAPLVAGAAALIRSICPLASNADLRAELFAAAVRIDTVNPGYEGKVGAGRMQMGEALFGSVLEPVWCSCDLDGDGFVGVGDLYEQTRTPRDLNQDGNIDLEDRDGLRMWVRSMETRGMIRR